MLLLQIDALFITVLLNISKKSQPACKVKAEYTFKIKKLIAHMILYYTKFLGKENPASE